MAHGTLLRSKQPLSAALLWCLLLLVGLASCTLPGTGAAATPTADPDLATLKDFPAYALRYSGTTLLRSGEAPRQPGLLGTNGTQVAKIYGLHAPIPV